MHCRCHCRCQYAVTTLSLSTVTVTPLFLLPSPLQSTVHCPLCTVAFSITGTVQSLSCHCVLSLSHQCSSPSVLHSTVTPGCHCHPPPPRHTLQGCSCGVHIQPPLPPTEQASCQNPPHSRVLLLSKSGLTVGCLTKFCFPLPFWGSWTPLMRVLQGLGSGHCGYGFSLGRVRVQGRAAPPPPTLWTEG